MNSFTLTMRLLLAAATLSLASLAQAQWTLDAANSTLQFVSVKNSAVGEVHSFKQLGGSISAAGEAQVIIDLTSVDTLIPIRNERMLEMLFEVAEHPTATVSVRLGQDTLASLGGGTVKRMTLPMTLSLHGFERELRVPLEAVQAGGRLHVYSQGPGMVSAADFDLLGGVEKLREVAGLNSISTAVPVNFNLQFSAD